MRRRDFIALIGGGGRAAVGDAGLRTYQSQLPFEMSHASRRAILSLTIQPGEP
jgi:hypothetical protein